MDLRISSIKLTNFRNYDELSLENIGALTIFVGNNAVGKTNLLESIELCTALSSFRNPTVDLLIKKEKSFARVLMDITDGNRQLELSLLLEPGKRQYKLNDKKKSVVDLKGLLPAVIFTPDDLELVKKASSPKRDALDALGSQLSKNYYIVKHDYEKVVRYKNRLLKEEAPDSLVLSINETLITCAAQLTCYRWSLFDRLSNHIASNYRHISNGELLRCSYYPSWLSGVKLEPATPLERDYVKKQLEKCLFEKLPEERARKRSVVGPHSDKILLEIDGNDIVDFASQGQQRSAVLSWKLAEVEVIRESLHKNPVLLLDDVMSELDEKRRGALIDFVEGSIQTFVTTTNLQYFDEELLSRAQVVSLPLEQTTLSVQPTPED